MCANPNPSAKFKQIPKIQTCKPKTTTVSLLAIHHPPRYQSPVKTVFSSELARCGIILGMVSRQIPPIKSKIQHRLPRNLEFKLFYTF